MSPLEDRWYNDRRLRENPDRRHPSVWQRLRFWLYLLLHPSRR